MSPSNAPPTGVRHRFSGTRSRIDYARGDGVADGGDPPTCRPTRPEDTVLMAHPVVLRNLVEQYLTLRALHAENGGAEVRRRLEDLAYTLCVSTGTKDVDAALVAARHRLPGARTADDSVLAG